MSVNQKDIKNPVKPSSNPLDEWVNEKKQAVKVSSSEDNPLDDYFKKKSGSETLPNPSQQTAEENTQPFAPGIQNTPQLKSASGFTSEKDDYKTNLFAPPENKAPVNNEISSSTFLSDTDKQELTKLSEKHKIPIAAGEQIGLAKIGLAPVNDDYKKDLLSPTQQTGTPKTDTENEYDNAAAIEANLKDRLQKIAEVKSTQRSPVERNNKSDNEISLENDLAKVQAIKKKAYAEITPSGDKEIEALVRTDESGNTLNRFENALKMMVAPTFQKGLIGYSNETKDKLQKLSPQFTTGLNYMKGIEPVLWERITDALATGKPISDSQVAQITAKGWEIDNAKLDKTFKDESLKIKPIQDQFNQFNNQLTALKTDLDGYENAIKSNQRLTPQEAADYKTKISQYNGILGQAKPLQEKLSAFNDQFTSKAEALKKVQDSNLLDRPEVLRSFLADNIGEVLDNIGKASQVSASPAKMVADFFTGHTWNYSPEQIQWAANQVAKKYGISTDDARVQAAIKYLQDNEGWMIGDNSIAKASGIRELAAGFADPIRQTWSSITDLGKISNDVYAESQSYGNVHSAENRLKTEDTGVRSVINDVLKGTGQFATQAGLMALTSGGIGATSEMLLGKAGVAALGGDIALADMGIKDLIGKALLKTKNPLAVYTTSFAMAYDSDLKQALNYTSDNSLAKKFAAFNANMEGLTELILSPLEIAEGIVHKFSKGQTKDLLKILSDKSLKDDPSQLKNFITKFVKGVAATSKVAGAEIGEEVVTQISDYLTNQYLNPNSQSFQSRDLMHELGVTAYQTGLTMAVPALLNGIGSMRANTFSKGSLLVAAQNRAKIADGLAKDLADHKIDQETFNTKVQLLNTAFQANNELPKEKADGNKFSTDDKANYVWSRVTEAVMNAKMATLDDAAQKQVLSKQIKEQQDYRAKILGNEEIVAEPSYKIDGVEVTKQEFKKVASGEDSDNYNFEVSGDDKMQEYLRSIGGIDDKVEEQKKEEKPISKLEALKQKRDAITTIEILKENKNVPPFEVTALLQNPVQGMQSIADQALGFGRDGETGERMPLHENSNEPQLEATIRKYGEDVVNKAIEMFPAVLPTPEKVLEDVPNDFEDKAEPVLSTYDATVRLGNGERIFAIHEQDEKPREVTSADEIIRGGYSADQLFAYPKELSTEQSGKDVKIKYGGKDKDLKSNPQMQWMKPTETSEQATNRLAEFVEASDYKGREQSTFIDRKGESVEVKLRNDDGKWNWYEPKSKKPFASFDTAKDAIKFIQEQPFWDNGELNKSGRNDAYFAKEKASYIQRQLDNGDILEDINDGKITAQDAKKIIESAGLEVPKDILELSTPKQQSGKDGVVDEGVVDKTEPKIATKVISALDKAAESKKSVREKDIAMEEAANKFGEPGKRALYINRNFDNIVQHLKTNNKIEVKCP